MTRPSRGWRWIATVLLVGLLVGACASEEGIVISDARIGKPAGPNAALYFTAVNSGESDRLVGVETDMASTVEIHQTVTAEDGTTGMWSLDGIDLTPGESLVLEPGGYHIMLVDVSPVEAGDSVGVTVLWEKTGPMTIQAEVVDPSDTVRD